MKETGDGRAPEQIPDGERDYYLERRYPSFGNLVPRDVASRAAKQACDEGRGVGASGRAVFLDFADAIKRRIVKKAYDKYKTQKTGKKNGVIDFWEDPELGDPAFYNACLRKMIGELDDYGKLVKPGMTYDEVEMLYERAVPKWMEIEYVIADLRSKYLSDQFFTEEAK